MLPSWVRVSNAVEDPVTRTALAQDQVVLVTGELDDWYSIETLDGESGRVPKVLAGPISNPIRVSGEQVYCTIAQFDAQRDGDLSLGLFTIVVVESIETEGWFRGTAVTDTGKRLGASGTFPATYVKPLPGFQSFLPETPRAPPITSSMTPSFTTDFADVRFRSNDVGPYARAIYDFQGESSAELSFNADDIIQLSRRIDGDWLEGKTGGRTGMFPQGYVQIVVPLTGEADDQMDDRRNSAQEEGIGFAIVRHDFEGRQKDELTVHMGDSVRVLEMVNGDWVKCRDPSTDSFGIVPLAFLDMYLDEDEEDLAGQRNSRPASSHAHDQTFGTLMDGSFNAPSVLPDWRTSTRLDDTIAESAALPSANSQSHQWATFGEDWLVPDKKSAPPARPPPPKSAFNSPNEVLSVAEMFGMADRQGPPRPSIPSVTTPADSESLKEKRNKVLEELISTEFQFVLDIKAYTDAVDASNRLSTKQKSMMKSGCAQITQLAGVLVHSLTTEQVKEWDQQSVGGCFLDLRKPFAQTYGYYFRNIEQINQLVNSSMTDSKVEVALKEIVTKMREAGAGVFDTPTAVTRPIQRCVKYPLFLSEIAKYTPIHHPDHPKLLEAVKQMSTLGQKMNESKRRKELTRKYSENQNTTTSIGGMLSKLTVHSLKKKSNRFTYRMGSSLGVVKLARDTEFDALVVELDGCERRLVRYNYMLVIYKKRIYFETRQLIQKKLIEIRKKQVVMTGMNIERQVQPFNDEVKLFSEQLNMKVRDEIVKALRAIPKKLIKKRNDKLMDWEAAKSKGNSNVNGKFLDFEALNAQVKQTLPKVIVVLQKVLHDAMITVRALDDHLCSQIKHKYAEAADDAAKDPYQVNRLIVPGIPCFALYYDPHRLQALQMIVTKSERKLRSKTSSSAGSGGSQTFSTNPAVDTSGSSTTKKNNSADDQKWKSLIFGDPDAAAPSADTTVPVSTAPNASASKSFRAQTMAERQVILNKAEEKGRRLDMYRCKVNWPATQVELEQQMNIGKTLIVNQGDCVLAVKRDSPGLWYCYNGYYSGDLPSSILTPWYEARQFGAISSDSSSRTGSSISPVKQTPILTRPHSTPPKQQMATNLIDLDDDLFGSSQPSLSSVPPLAALIPIPVGAAASMSALSGPPATAAPVSAGTPSLFDGVRPVDWGTSPASNQNPWATPVPSAIPWDHQPMMSQRTPSLPNLPQPTNLAFPVTFDESPKDSAPTVAVSVVAHLPPPAPSRPTTSTNLISSQDAFTTLWDQIKDKPLSSVTNRSESPLPLIPTRPEPSVAVPSSSLSPMYANVGVSLPTSAVKPMNAPSSFAMGSTTYDTVPSEMYSQAPMYSLPPLYDMVPSTLPLQPTTNGFVSGAQLYDAPPTEAPMSTGTTKPEIARMRVCFDFTPVDSQQMAVRAGEIVSLLQAHDDVGNPEWIWVRRQNLTNGYVPAAYCEPV